MIRLVIHNDYYMLQILTAERRLRREAYMHIHLLVSATCYKVLYILHFHSIIHGDIAHW